MHRITKFLERAFAVLDGYQAALSARWRPHTNRRTLIIVLVCGVAALYLWLAVIQPPASFPTGELVTVDDGASVAEVASALEGQGVIRSPLAFRLIVRALGAERSVHAGDYVFKQPRNIFSVAHSVAIGAFGLEPIRIRVPEGATVQQMSVIFSTRLSRFNAENFIAQAGPEEGYLFPDTYFFLPNATEDTVLRALRQNFDDHIALLEQQIASSTHSIADIVTMASIIEREAYNTKDRKLISGVLWNRIELDMPLQVDAPFAYTLGKGTFDLTMDDLTSDSPYNTYVHKGLTPTPIGSPSLDSLEAALDPTPSDYLYFLADKSGITHYCETYKCQLANKERYF